MDREMRRRGTPYDTTPRGAEPVLLSRARVHGDGLDAVSRTRFGAVAGATHCCPGTPRSVCMVIRSAMATGTMNTGGATDRTTPCSRPRSVSSAVTESSVQWITIRRRADTIDLKRDRNCSERHDRAATATPARQCSRRTVLPWFCRVERGMVR